MKNHDPTTAQWIDTELRGVNDKEESSQALGLKLQFLIMLNFMLHGWIIQAGWYCTIRGIYYPLNVFHMIGSRKHASHEMRMCSARAERRVG